MATAYQSSSTSAFATANSVTITKPTGLAVGDLMIAHIVMTATGGTNQDVTGPSGWTLLDGTLTTATSPYMKTSVWYIVATSTEVAATNFTWNIINQSGVSVGGGILRIDGQNTVTAIDIYSKDNTVDNPGSNPTYIFSGADPTFGDSLLVIFSAAAQTTSDRTTSSYEIATSNPSWTERWDFNHSGSGVVMNCATALRTEDTATGNVTVTFDGLSSNADKHGFLIVVKPIASISIAPDPLILTLSIQAPTVTVGATASPSVISLTLSIPTPTVGINNWVNPTKNSASFTNQSKNSSTWTNSSKNSSTWTNESKTQ